MGWAAQLQDLEGKRWARCPRSKYLMDDASTWGLLLRGWEDEGMKERRIGLGVRTCAQTHDTKASVLLMAQPARDACFMATVRKRTSDVRQGPHCGKPERTWHGGKRQWLFFLFRMSNARYY